MIGQHAGPVGAPTVWQRLGAWARTAPGRYRKALAAIWGTLTVPALVGLASLAGWHLDPGTAALVITIGAAVLGTSAVAAARPNDPPTPPLAAVDPLYAEDVPRLPSPNKE